MERQNVDQVFMERAFHLAALGREWVSPNPMVGCVIVHDGLIIGEGFHQKYGEAHAEVNAVNSVVNKELLPESTVYVTLEPCSHFGKTPPCADLLIKHKVKKVVVCNLDPFPQVSGNGIKKLQDAGIEVVTGVLATEGEELNKRFFKAQRTGLPYVVIKWAETSDGFVAQKNGNPLAISNTTTNITVHRWRAEEAGILVGTNTVLTDNPQLNARNWPESNNPTRIIIDKNLRINGDFNVFDQKQNTLIYNLHKKQTDENLEFIQINFEEGFLKNMLSDLKNRGINSILVEGGPQIIQSFFEEQLYDEIRVVKSDMVLKEGVSAPKVPSGIPLVKNYSILNDQIFIFTR
ncbi:bifunctional diaminohydroxyphosphoribosylaminopyrimidine deaminase/5-amino-6-(5-phosphoribosylamino)uracil reductase RibD [Lacihabitans sp. CCS-44]|uniref:bifunctional diaminohydroxyphosphoribosylaminopyrimidine deaminase/5-amino-6-(5-phosphoribosylamino)uracil reductase RibD n=1 Tax=Lacihabitans sp. CCS-44 TaxID=2487331 RepID=UPI0020CDAE96|nr:bifunctional diaminohydroxyphosphoribosylaminopyrimidine deaminase/5-amino-6-(5-phosphoribosylamino)uracil reductase RibD [Lacihabitans sp. CCS-44]MCP9753874.1 bifunctional diaminohydroxyphosphoribosylaminopyrimidine deaminase/5-amino-6-(5-phosphoribosylamino)uracil reductase RibD [Lacihabitans sp. CCS-44]